MDHYPNDLQYSSTSLVYQQFPKSASEMISPLHIVPQHPYATASRVSHRTQDQKGNLQAQQNLIHNAVTQVGGIVALAFTHVGSGKETQWLKDIIEECKQHNLTTIVFESTDRIIRHPSYGHKEQFLQAGPEQWQLLEQLKGEITLMTVLHPDSTYVQENLSRQSRRKEILSRKQRRELLLPMVKEYLQAGLTVREIADLVTQRSGFYVGKSTVNRWIRGL